MANAIAGRFGHRPAAAAAAAAAEAIQPPAGVLVDGDCQSLLPTHINPPSVNIFRTDIQYSVLTFHERLHPLPCKCQGCRVDMCTHVTLTHTTWDLTGEPDNRLFLHTTRGVRGHTFSVARHIGHRRYIMGRSEDACMRVQRAGRQRLRVC